MVRSVVKTHGERDLRALEQELRKRPTPVEAEREAGEYVVAGRKAQAKLRRLGDTLTSEERALLTAVIRLGQWSRDALVEANMTLVSALAKRHLGRGLDFEDLCQEGAIGLMRAIDGFDWDRGLRLSTYATWWIRQAMSRAICDRGRLVRLPASAHEDLRKMLRAGEELAGRLEREPALAEVALEAGISLERAQDLTLALAAPVSLDAPVGTEARPVEEVVGDGEPTPDERACAGAVSGEIAAVFAAVLTEREALVMRLRYGLVDGETWTLDSIGARLGVTRERARQLEAQAMAKLRAAPAANALRAHLATG